MARGELFTEADDGDRVSDVDAALAAFGLVLESAVPEQDRFCLWPDNLTAFSLFADVQTQWRNGFSGPTGLDYLGVRASPAFRRIPRAEREAAFSDACVMERAWLTEKSRLSAEAP
jgi:hypothetical protein